MDEEKDLKEKTREMPETIKDKKAKGVIRRRKPKTEKPIATALHLLVESGRVEFGGRRGFKNTTGGKVKAIVVSKNAPKEMKENIIKYCKIGNLPVIDFEGSSIELGSACGKPFPVSVISIFDQGSSNIIEMAKKISGAL